MPGGRLRRGGSGGADRLRMCPVCVWLCASSTPSSVISTAMSAGSRRPCPGPRRTGLIWLPSPSWPSPGIPPRISFSSPPSWPTTSPPCSGWLRPRRVAWPWSGSSTSSATTAFPTPSPGPTGPVWWPARRPSVARRVACATPWPSAPGATFSASTTSAGCPTTAFSTRSAGLRRGPPRSSSTGWAAFPSECRSARTCGSRLGPSRPRRPAAPVLIVNVNASPFSVGRQADRLAAARARVTEAGCAIAYVNQVGGQDELVFDGGSFVVDRTGAVVAAAPQFVETVLTVDVDIDIDIRMSTPAAAFRRRPPDSLSCP